MTAPDRNGRPVVSVLLVSDYAAGGLAAWDSLRRTLSALARQDFEGTAEFLLLESEELAAEIPADLAEILPSLRIARSPHRGSYALKNEAVRAAAAERVAILDADCTPEPDWLRRLVDALDREPDAAAVSGRTVYPGGGRLERILGLLSRAYLDPGRPGSTRFISNNNAGWRRSPFLAHPLPTDLGPFASRVQSEAVLRAGGRLLFDPEIRVRHDFEGWRMEADIRRNIGYGTVITRLRDGRTPHAWLVRLGYPAIPLIAAAKTLANWADCVRCRRHYRVGWHELPLALCLSVLVHILEIPGMWAAFRRRELAPTAYR